MIEILHVSNDADPAAARASMLNIMNLTPLCTMATVGEDSSPHAATAFYVFDSDLMEIYVLTGPDTTHGRNIIVNGRAALTIFSSAQQWPDAKRGVQLITRAGLTSADQLDRVLAKYLESYPGLGKWVQKASDIDAALESRFFTFSIDHCKVFDEPNFGTEVWIDIEIGRS